MAQKKDNTIRIGNFLNMMPHLPQYSDKNQNYLMVGVDPISYLSNGNQEQQIAPLVASKLFNIVNIGSSPLTFTNPLIEMIDAAGDGQSDDIVVSDNKLNVFSIANGSIALTVPTPPSAVSNAVCKMACFSSCVLMVSPQLSEYIYYYSIPHGVLGWQTITTDAVSTAFYNLKYLKTFLNYCIGSNGSKIFVISNTITGTFSNPLTAFDLGAQWDIKGLENIDGQYLAIVAAFGNNSLNYYLHIWDGISLLPNFKVKLAGQFIDMYVNQGILYVTVLERAGQSALYFLSGKLLKRVQSIQYDSISQINSLSGNTMFSYMGLIGLRLATKGVMVLGQMDAGQIEFVIAPDPANNGNSTYTKLLSAGYGSNAGGALYAIYGNSIYMYGFVVSGGIQNYNEINYKSQWIPVKNLSAIDVLYDSTPGLSTGDVGDSINVVLDGLGEDINNQTGSETIPLMVIYSTQFLTAKRTRLDVQGFVGDKCRVSLTTVNGAWQPIIRGLNLIQQ